jgi:predicted DNA-binding transcriptional regulator YafY
MFKLMRIEDVEILDETYHLPADYTVHSYLRDTFSLTRGKEYIVEIQFFHPASIWVAEKLWLPTQKIVALKNDSILFKARVDGLEDIKKWVMGFGRLARVLKPQELVDQIIQETCEIRKLYGESGVPQKKWGCK